MFKNIYYKIIRDIAIVKFMAALISSPERYKYISEQVSSGKLTNKEATEKNINKAIIMAEQIVDEIKKIDEIKK